ncbi:hypothetical protein [Streptomyces goshikiensis]|uniref:hypothetical protein n=1 Tax=Streptomyces goshikiensis TaxID=1942 RepID=UPI0036B64F13
MSGMQDKRQQPGKGREEQDHPQRQQPGQGREEQDHLQRQRPGQDEPKDMQGRRAHERGLKDPTRERKSEREMNDDMRDDAL